MKYPRMTEVFRLHEVNVTTLSQMHKLPIEVANQLNAFDPKNADIHAKIFNADMVRGQGKNWDKSMWKSSADFYTGEAGTGIGADVVLGTLVKAYLKTFPNKAKELRSMNKDSLDKFIQDDLYNWDSSELSKEKAKKEYSDGSYWVEVLSMKAKEKEACDMQHCGLSTGDMYSYRDANDKPHLTADVKGKELVQMRGKQNKDPDRKYWEKAKDFVHFMGLTKSSDFNTQGEINDESTQEFSNFIFGKEDKTVVKKEPEKKPGMWSRIKSAF